MHGGQLQPAWRFRVPMRAVLRVKGIIERVRDQESEVSETPRMLPQMSR